MDVQGDNQGPQSQHHRGDAGEQYLVLLGHIGLEGLAQIVDHCLHRHQQIAVRRGHHHRQDTGESQTRKARGQDLDGQGGDHRVGGAILRRHVRQDLLGCQAHGKEKDNGHRIGKGAPEHTLFCRLGGFSRKGPLPHLRPRHGEHQVGDDIAQDLAVEVGSDIPLVQALPEVPQAPQVADAGGGDQEVDEDDEHEELHHVGVHHAEKTRGRGVNDKDQCSDKGPHLIADAHLVTQELDDGGSGGDLGGHSAHHGKDHHYGQDTLGRLTEAVAEQLRDGLDAVLLAHPLDAAGVARKEEHAQHIGNGGGHRLEALLIGHRCPAHHGAAADDGGAHRGHQHHGAQGAARHIEVVGVPDPLDKPHAYQQHPHQVQPDDPQIQHGNFRHRTLLSHLWPEGNSAPAAKRSSRLGQSPGGKGQFPLKNDSRPRKSAGGKGSVHCKRQL